MIGNPFKGASQYEESDRERFFGREGDGTQLFRRLLADRELILHSPSGSGKSSLLRADLMARLGDRGFLMPKSPLRPSTLLSESAGSEHHLQYHVAFWRYLFNAYDIKLGAGSELITSADEWLAHVRGDIKPQEEIPPIAIVIDQTEEIFTHPESTIGWRQTFFDCLGQIARVERVWLIMAVREDFLARLLSYHDLFVTELRSRYSLALFDANTVREIVDKTLGCVDVKLDAETLDHATQCVLQSCLPPSERRAADRLQAERVIEPLFLQIFGAGWWDRAGGEPEKLSEGPFTPSALKSVLVEYIDHCLGQAANCIVNKQTEILTDPVEAESRMRYWLGHELIRKEVRWPGLLTDDLSAGADQLERSYLIQRSQLGESMAELTHDQLVSAIKQSNTNWYAQTPSGQTWKSYQVWAAGGERVEDLMGLPRVLETYRGQRKFPVVMKEYLKRSLWHSLKWLAGLAGIACVILAVWAFAGYKANQAREEAADAKNRLNGYFSAMRSQDLIAKAWSSYGRGEAAPAIGFSLAARLEAKDAGDRRLPLSSRAEQVLGRALAAPVAVEYRDSQKAKNACDNQEQVGDGDSDGACITNTIEASNNVIVHVERDRRHLSPKGISRHNYSFASLTDTRKRSEVPRRLWLSFGDQALIEDKAVMVGFPSEEETSRIVAGQAFWEGRDLRGFSISEGGRLYVWSATKSDIDNCLEKPYHEEKTTENDACRILRTEGNVQLFDERVVAVSPVEKTDGKLYAFRFEVESSRGRAARVSLRRGHFTGAPWPGDDLPTSDRGDWATAFFTYTDTEKIDHVWLITNGPTVELASDSNSVDGKNFTHGRAAWCDQIACADGTAFWLSRNGARATFRLSDGKLSGPVKESEIAKQCAPLLGQAVVLDKGALILAAGVAPPLPSNKKVNCDEKIPGPVLAIISNDTRTSTPTDATNFELLPLRDLLPEKMQDDEVDGLAVDGDLLGLVSTAGRAAICKLTSRMPVKLEGCHLLIEAASARGIAILGGFSDDVSEVVAVNDKHGQVTFFDRDGQRFRTIKSAARAGTKSMSNDNDDRAALENVKAAYPPPSNDRMGSHLPILLLKEEAGDVRAITAANDNKVTMRLYEIAKAGVRGGIPVIIAEMDSNVRALYALGGAVYAGSARGSVTKLVTSTEAVRTMACTELSIGRATAGEGDEMERTYSRQELCGAR